MITNPAAAMRMLITYVICIPLAVLVGYLLTNPLDYGTLGFLGLVIAFVISPVFIKWHYPLMVFSLSSPIVLFFLKGSPPLSQVMVVLCLSIAIINRILRSEQGFISIPCITWPLVFTLVVVVFTAELTGGIGFHSLGGDAGVVGGGRKYLAIFVGVATFYALCSRTIAPHERRLYLMLFFLPTALGLVSDLFSYLPYPLKYINLIVPPSGYSMDSGVVADAGIISFKRFGGFSAAGGALLTFMLARHGVQGMLGGKSLWRLALLLILVLITLFGGFRSGVINLAMTLGLLFFFEGLYRTRLLPVLVMGLVMICILVVPFAGKLPLSMQRSLAFLPLTNLDSEIVIDAQGSTDWRLNMWSFLWPQVPKYLLLGKGFGLTKDDYTLMGQGNALANATEAFDPTSAGLAVSSDYHSGPLSTIIPFGIWGAIAFLWLTLAGLRLLYLNYKYGEPELHTINRFLLVFAIVHWVGFFFIFGAYANDVGYFAMIFGFSVALNGGMRRPLAAPAMTSRVKPLPSPQAT